MSLEQQVWGFGRVECPPFDVRCGYQLPGQAGLGMYAGWEDGFDIPNGFTLNLPLPGTIDMPGLSDPQPFQYGYDMPGIRGQLHIHGPNPTTITEAHIKTYDGLSIKPVLSGYDASIADLNALDLGFRRFP